MTATVADSGSQNTAFSQNVMIGGLVGVVLVALLVGLTIARRKRRKSVDSLFGSTIKYAPESPTIQTVGVQPIHSIVDGTLKGSDSATDLENFGLPHKISGLSSELSRWSVEVDKKPQNDKEEKTNRKWKLSFKIQYKKDEGKLEVTIFRAKCYPMASPQTAGNPTSQAFVIVYLLPNQEQHQTESRDNTGSPSFEDCFVFNVKTEKFKEKKLRLSLYDMDNSLTRICLGHSILKLSDLANVQAGGVAYLNKDLEQLKTVLDEQGPEIHVSLCYNVVSETLKIQIFAARNLPENKPGMTYKLRTNVILGTQTAKTRETKTSESLYGVFQCNYNFVVPQKRIDSCCLQFSLLGFVQGKEEEILASLLIGPCMYAHGRGFDHWKSMLHNTRKPVEMWHKLTMTNLFR